MIGAVTVTMGAVLIEAVMIEARMKLQHPAEHLRLRLRCVFIVDMTCQIAANKDYLIHHVLF